LDQLSAQVGELAEELRRQRQERERRSELIHELTPVAQAAMDLLSRELNDLRCDVDAEDAVRFLRTLARTLPRLEAALARLDSLAELMADVTSLAGSNLGRLSESLAVAQQKGYFRMVAATADVVETAVTVIDEEDLQALRQNVVPLVDAVREVTRPETLSAVRRTAVALRESGAQVTPPSTLTLLRQVHSPQIRLALARLLAVLGEATRRPDPVPPTRTGTARTAAPSAAEKKE
jgi:hypothetical protein